MTAPKIDTQAPQLNLVFGRDNSALPEGWTLHFGDGAVHHRNGNAVSSYGIENGMRAYLAILASLSAAREAAAWIAGRDAAKAQCDPYGGSMTSCNCDLWIEEYCSTPPKDPATALDRLIAERVREAVEAWALMDHFAVVLQEDDGKYVSVKQEHYEAARAATIAARGSKEGRDG